MRIKWVDKHVEHFGNGLGQSKHCSVSCYYHRFPDEATEAQSNPGDLSTGFAVISLQLNEDTGKGGAEWHVSLSSHKDMESRPLDSSSSIFPPHPVTRGYHSMWERTDDESGKTWTTQQLVPSHCEQSCVSWRTEVAERQPSATKSSRRRRRVHQSRSTSPCKLIKLSWDTCVLTWAKKGSPPTGSSFSSAKHTKYVLSQNNCPLLTWRVSKTQWLVRCPEIDHFIIKQASQGNKCFGRKANRQTNKKKWIILWLLMFLMLWLKIAVIFFFFFWGG